MNSIPKAQNEESSLCKLATQRQLYSSAKRILAIQLVLTGPVATFAAFLAIIFPTARPFLAIWGIALTLLDIFWLTEWQKRKREQAAKAQESFDCEVLELPWNALKVGTKLDPELIREQSEIYKAQAAAMPTLQDWYPIEFGQLPLHIARVACQRTNCWWDGKQRRLYSSLILPSITTVILAALATALFAPITYKELMISVFLPLSPMIVAGIRQYREQALSAERCDKLKEHANLIWAQALEGASAAKLKKECRALQDEIYEGRKRNPPIFDWIFRRLRNKYEDQMSFGAQQLVLEASTKLNLQPKQEDGGRSG